MRFMKRVRRNSLSQLYVQEVFVSVCRRGDRKKQYGHCFACVQWFKEYPNNSLFKNPLSVYYAKVFKLPGPATFIPVQRIQSRFVAINRKNNNVDTVIVCPLLPRTFI